MGDSKLPCLWKNRNHPIDEFVAIMKAARWAVVVHFCHYFPWANRIDVLGVNSFTGYGHWALLCQVPHRNYVQHAQKTHLRLPVSLLDKKTTSPLPPSRSQPVSQSPNRKRPYLNRPILLAGIIAQGLLQLISLRFHCTIRWVKVEWATSGLSMR